jgi:hypothetical protein
VEQFIWARGFFPGDPNTLKQSPSTQPTKCGIFHDPPTSLVLQNFNSNGKVGSSGALRCVDDRNFVKSLRQGDVETVKVVWKRREVNP